MNLVRITFSIILIVAASSFVIFRNPSLFKAEKIPLIFEIRYILYIYE